MDYGSLTNLKSTFFGDRVPLNPKNEKHKFKFLELLYTLETHLRDYIFSLHSAVWDKLETFQHGNFKYIVFWICFGNIWGDQYK